MVAFNDDDLPGDDRQIDDAIDAGIAARDLYDIARDDVIGRADLRVFLRAAIHAWLQKRGV